MQTTSTRWGCEGLNSENFSWTSILKQSEEEREAIAEAERKAKKRRLMAMGLAGKFTEIIYIGWFFDWPELSGYIINPIEKVSEGVAFSHF